MEAKRQIDFYLDFTSPYAYLAATRIDALAARHEHFVVWHPFLIGATFNTTGRKAPVDHPLVWEYTLNDVQRCARLLKQPLNFPIKFPLLSVKPARLFYHLQDRESDQSIAKEFALAVYHAYFVDQKDITDNRALGEICVPFGLDEAAIELIVRSSEMKARFKAEVESAIERGVFGAPTFIVKGEMFWGVDRMDQLEKWLETGGW